MELEALLKTTPTAEECSLVCLLADGSAQSVAFLKNPLLTYFRGEVQKMVVRTKGDQSMAVEFQHDRVIALKRERPDALFPEFLRISQTEEVPSGGDALLFTITTVSLLILGSLGLVWAIRRLALHS